MRRLFCASVVLVLLNACVSQSVNHDLSDRNGRLPTVAGAPTCPGEDCWQAEVMADVLGAVIEYRFDKAERQDRDEPFHPFDERQ
ncbi:hypothetical protein HPT27_02105 [Permianibacter sp. IMCC34836]|uniref:hypothetical protein n=1 Tax=Permianibacter fluminis TaxID=2738515 RepID=UPI001552595A|nr:hypothetical protein [Permianibacter fluminis]NQD35796.1 hypothetical protein [Permianibacter fluminis]